MPDLVTATVADKLIDELLQKYVAKYELVKMWQTLPESGRSATNPAVARVDDEYYDARNRVRTALLRALDPAA